MLYHKLHWGGATGGPEFLLGPPFEPPLVRVFVWLMFICYFLLYLFLLHSLTYRFITNILFVL